MTTANHMTAEQLRAEILQHIEVSRMIAGALDLSGQRRVAAHARSSIPFLESIAKRLLIMAPRPWQPIETAPRDGTYYLATDGEQITIENHPLGFMPGTWRRGENGRWSGYASRPIGYSPTLWTELPQLPR